MTPSVILVTGAARGIGAAIASAVAAAGHAVAVCDIDQAAAEATARRLAADHGVAVIGFGMDVASPEGTQAAIAEVERALGPIGGLVNNAGIDVIKPFIESTEDEWDRIIGVNLKGTVRVCRGVLDGMI